MSEDTKKIKCLVIEIPCEFAVNTCKVLTAESDTWLVCSGKLSHPIFLPIKSILSPCWKDQGPKKAHFFSPKS